MGDADVDLHLTGLYLLSKMESSVKVLDQLIVFARAVGDLDDFTEIGGILGLDIEFYVQKE
jgi:hypothetical protein